MATRRLVVIVLAILLYTLPVLGQTLIIEQDLLTATPVSHLSLTFCPVNS